MSKDFSHVSEAINGLHIKCPDDSPSRFSDEDPKGSRTHRQRARGRSQPFFIGVAGDARAYCGLMKKKSKNVMRRELLANW
jgi:hypothetical protein